MKFESSYLLVMNDDKGAFVALRHGNSYVENLRNGSSFNEKCLVTLDESAPLWHRRLAHAPFPLITKLSKNEIVSGLSKIKFSKEHLCEPLNKGKHSFRLKRKLLHLGC